MGWKAAHLLGGRLLLLGLDGRGDGVGLALDEVGGLRRVSQEDKRVDEDALLLTCSRYVFSESGLAAEPILSVRDWRPCESQRSPTRRWKGAEGVDVRCQTLWCGWFGLGVKW